jgi:predicted nucleotidyltransferase
MAQLVFYRQTIDVMLKQHGARNAYVFGSVARGTDTEKSDIDIVVDFDAERFGLIPLSRLAEDLSTLLGETVHVAARSLLKSAVLARVHEEQVPL